MRLLISMLTLATLAGGCAYNATGTLPRPTLIFEFSVEGDALARGNNVAYYFALDTAGTPEDGPLVNGPAPLSFPYPDPRSYLPFVRDESAVLDREPVAVPNTVWTDFFALFEEAGQRVMWQGRRNPDGSINERYRLLQEGREWGIKNGKTIQLTLPFDQLTNYPAFTERPQIEANLAVGTRGLDTQRGWVIERWGQVQNQFFQIQTRQINQNLYDTVGGVTFPQNLSGLDPRSVNLVSISYRVTLSE